MTPKSEILREIRRVAKANGDKPPGSQRFQRETGIQKHEWYPHVWLRWGDALTEAGFTPNLLQQAYSKAELLKVYAHYARELGRLPVSGELRRKSRIDPQFPSTSTYEQRFASKAELVRQLGEYCDERETLRDVARMCDEYCLRTPAKSAEPQRQILGFVYLMKSGRRYKIGHSMAVGRREYDLGIKLPDELKTIHVIKTDDPCGVEAYWHKRFESKNVRGEWFKLDSADVAAFKRTKNVG